MAAKKHYRLGKKAVPAPFGSRGPVAPEPAAEAAPKPKKHRRKKTAAKAAPAHHVPKKRRRKKAAAKAAPAHHVPKKRRRKTSAKAAPAKRAHKPVHHRKPAGGDERALERYAKAKGHKIVTLTSILSEARKKDNVLYICAGKKRTGCGGGKKGTHVVGHLR